MDTIQEILLFTILVIQLCTKAAILISRIQSILYARKREQREQKQAASNANHRISHINSKKMTSLPYDT